MGESWGQAIGGPDAGDFDLQGVLYQCGSEIGAKLDH